MPITPLHIAYVWPLKRRFRGVEFSALTLGAMIPDLENPVLYLIGYNPNRLITHSLIGVFTVDILLTFLAVGLVSRLRLERIGIYGFRESKLGKSFVASASIGALSHILIDELHHEYNPIFWLIGPAYVGSPLYITLGEYAHTVVNLLSLFIILYLVKTILNRQSYSLSFIVKDPIKALEIVTTSLSQTLIVKIGLDKKEKIDL